MSDFNLPADHRPYIDKYFLRAKEVLVKDNLNPTVKAQVFIRNGNCRVYGIDETIAILSKYADTTKLKVCALKEGDSIQKCETVLTIEAPIQEIMDLETMYLGVISAETTKKNDGDISIADIETNMRKIVDLAKGRPVSYFGARHWRWDMDAIIAKACFDAGATSCSTDIGGATVNQEGVGTIPHALECIYHWKYGLKRAVVEATKAFDKYIDKIVPRIALIDYANREIRDSLTTIAEIPHLYGVRVDTCGENYMQGCYPSVDDDNDKFNFGKGVCTFGVSELTRIIKDEGDYKVILSSGFGNPEKLEEFLAAEEALDCHLFDGLGVGGVYDARISTMDIIEVEGQEIHKVGRPAKPNEKLQRII